jgi:hypothetical protein
MSNELYSQEEAELLEDLKHGVLLGGAGFVERMRTTIDGDTVKEQPQKRKLLQTKPVAELVQEISGIAGISQEDLSDFKQPLRRRSRPMRDLLIFLVWRNSQHNVQAIADFFGMNYSSISAARSRGQEYLCKNRKIRSAIKKHLSI